MHSEHGFDAAIDWLSSGHAGKFGQHLAELALECDSQQLCHLLHIFRHEFDRAATLSELYDWAEIPLDKTMVCGRSITTNKLL